MVEVVYHELPALQHFLGVCCRKIFGKSLRTSLMVFFPLMRRHCLFVFMRYLADPKHKRKRTAPWANSSFLFNGRLVMHRHLTHVSLEQYYKIGSCDSRVSRFFCHFFCLNVDLPRLDVNVHPSKMEN